MALKEAASSPDPGLGVHSVRGGDGGGLSGRLYSVTGVIPAIYFLTYFTSLGSRQMQFMPQCLGLSPCVYFDVLRALLTYFQRAVSYSTMWSYCRRLNTPLVPGLSPPQGDKTLLGR